MNTLNSFNAPRPAQTACQSLLLAALCSASALVLAQEPLTRAEVISALNAARASGELLAFTQEDSGSFWMAQQPRTSTLTRKAVRAAVLDARSQSQLSALTGEDCGSFAMGRQAPQPALIYAGPNVGEPGHALAAPGHDSA